MKRKPLTIVAIILGTASLVVFLFVFFVVLMVHFLYPAKTDEALQKTVDDSVLTPQDFFP